MRRLIPLLALLAVLVAPAYAASTASPASTPASTPAATASPAPNTDPIIALGVSVGGVDVGGLHISQAAAKLRAALGPAFARSLSVRVAGHRLAISAKRAHVAFDAALTARRAFHFGLEHPPAPVPTPAAGGTAPPPAGPPLAITYSKRALRTFTAAVAAKAARKPVDATAHIELTRIRATHSAPGRALTTKAFNALAIATLSDPAAAHVVAAPVHRVQPKVKVDDLKHIYGTVLTVDRNNFRLRLFKALRLSKSYGIAVGMAGLETPAGLYSITEKIVNPSWHVPNSPWAGALAGQTIPPGPADPIKARWLGITSGVGIHGTSEDWSIGSRASHGCIRMHISDVIDLYPRVPFGTPVLIG